MAGRIDQLDLAQVKPCQGCGTPTRMLSVPIGGSGLDPVFATTTTCDPCLQAKCEAAADPVWERMAAANGG